MRAGARRVDGRNRAGCEMEFRWAPPVGRIVWEVRGGFKMGWREFAGCCLEGWVPRREGGRGYDRADMGRSSAAPVHDRGLRMLRPMGHRASRLAGVVARREGGNGCDLADMGRSGLRPYMTMACGGFVARRMRGGEGCSCGRRKMTTSLGVRLYTGRGAC